MFCKVPYDDDNDDDEEDSYVKQPNKRYKVDDALIFSLNPAFNTFSL